jgi:hypothetical protein
LQSSWIISPEFIGLHQAGLRKRILQTVVSRELHYTSVTYSEARREVRFTLRFAVSAERRTVL